MAFFVPDGCQKGLNEVRKGLVSASISPQTITLLPDEKGLQRRRDFKLKMQRRPQTHFVASCILNISSLTLNPKP